MTTNSVKVTLQIRHDTSSNWITRNPILAEGEYGLELDTFLIKVGDGIKDWEHLPYLNKLDSSYFKWEADGTLTFSDEFLNTISTMEAVAGDAITSLTITNPPVNDTDAVNKKYVDDAVLTLKVIEGARVPGSNGIYEDIAISMNKKLELARIAKTGNIEDIIQSANTYIILDCGTSTTVL